MLNQTCIWEKGWQSVLYEFYPFLFSPATGATSYVVSDMVVESDTSTACDSVKRDVCDSLSSQVISDHGSRASNSIMQI
jgi:hypothetical protein